MGKRLFNIPYLDAKEVLNNLDHYPDLLVLSDLIRSGIFKNTRQAHEYRAYYGDDMFQSHSKRGNSNIYYKSEVIDWLIRLPSIQDSARIIKIMKIIGYKNAAKNRIMNDILTKNIAKDRIVNDIKSLQDKISEIISSKRE